MEDYSKRNNNGSFGYKSHTPLTQGSNSFSGVYSRQTLKPNYRRVNHTDSMNKTKDMSFPMKILDSSVEFCVNRYEEYRKSVNNQLTDTQKAIINLVFWGIFLYFTYIAVCMPCCIVTKAAALHAMFFLLLGKIIWNNITKSE